VGARIKEMTMQQPMNDPKPRWWNTNHDTMWNRARQELRNDPNFRSISDQQWTSSEDGMRYGYGAASQYHTEPNWTDKVEAKLKEEWTDLKTGRTWDEVKTAVRNGWDAARRKLGRA
jgi:hypothetical protein